MASELVDIPDEYRTMDIVRLETLALGLPPDTTSQRPAARLELLRRDREYAEQQERERREWETKHQAARQEFEEKLADRQMDHAAALARDSLTLLRQPHGPPSGPREQP